MRLLLVFLLANSCAGSVCAAVVVLSNATADTVTCQVKVGDSEPAPVQLAPGETKPVTCGRAITLSFTAQDGVQNLQLEPYTAYIFETRKKTGLELKAAGLMGKSPGVRDVPMASPKVEPVKIKVRIYVDDAERRTKPVWSAALKKRLADASDILSKEAGVTFEAVDFEEWEPAAGLNTLPTLLADFEKQFTVENSVAIGYVSRAIPPAGKQQEVPFAISRGLFAPHILIREGDPRTEAERVEVLVQQLGRYFGAVVSPDPFSVMRPKLGDGQAIHVKFRIGFDPLNMLAVNIVADEYRKGPPKNLAEWPQETQVRLARIYGTLYAATPEESMNDEVTALLQRAGLKAAPEVRPMPKDAEMPKRADAPKVPDAPKSSKSLPADQDAIRKVVKAIVLKAEENARKPAVERVKGDALTELYIRTAADIAYGLDEKLRKKAFLAAIGIALDDSNIIRSKPVIGDLWKAVESEDDQRARTLVLNNPTIKQRRDWCQHFCLSAALTALGDAESAEAAGIAKETLDMKDGGSGFSFADFGADYAGIAFAERVLETGEFLKTIRDQFTVEAYVPKLEDLPDGLKRNKFEADYGGFTDKRYRDAIAAVKKRVRDLHPKK